MTEIREPGFLMSRRGFMISSGAALAAVGLPFAARAQDAAVLRYALSAFPPGLDPWRHEGNASIAVKLQIYRGLLGLDTGNKVIGELAEKWELEGDKTYVFHLRKNAKFQNGEPVTGKDVAWSFEQITKKGSQAYLSSEMKVISSIDVVDDNTVKVNLSQPTPAFPKLLATSYVPVISEKGGLEKPVGAGPYRITNSEQGVGIELEAFDGYYKEGLPKTKRLKMIVYADENLRVAALESGDVDIIEYVPWQAMAKVEGNADLVLQETTGPNMIIVFNTEQAPFNDPRVRQAVAYAIKREDIVKTAFYGRGAPLVGLPLDEDSDVASDRTLKLWSYDPDKAKKLLEEAGVVGQKVTLLSSSTYSMHQDTALVVQQSLNAVGLQVELDLPEWGARVAQGNNGQYQFAINGNSTTVNDPSGLTAMIGSGPASYQRSWGYSNKQLDDLLAQGSHELDKEKRQAVYDSIADLVKDDVPICTLTRRTQGFGLRKNVQDFQSLPGSSNSYSCFLLEQTALA